MNTPLQRLVDRARGRPQGPTLRIEPLLGTPFAVPAGAAQDLPEIEVETEAEADASIRRAAASLPSTSGHVRRPAAAMDPAPASGRADPPGTAHSSPDAPQPAAARATTENEAQATTPPARSPAPATTKAARGREARHGTDTEPTPAPALPECAPHALPRRAPSASAMPRAPVAAAQPQQMHPAPIEATPGITIAIGRVEVRGAPAPALRGPSRPPFKPGLSLDAFLRRGKGDGP